MNPLFLTDFYKVYHLEQYPKKTSLVYSNFTPRKSRTTSDKMVFFGLQYFIKKYLIEEFNENFFKKPKQEIMDEYKSLIDRTLGQDSMNIDHIGRLHDLGYLPLHIEALPEGTLVPMQTPMFTLWNTHPDFFWITNYLETLISSVIWKPCTSATTSSLFKKNFNKYADITGANKDFVQFQAHDFAFRGMSNPDDAALSGAGHLLNFVGTDTIPSILLLEKYYNAIGLVGTSVKASEHSTMVTEGEENEYEVNDRLLTEVYPNGIFSMVSDSFDFWKLVSEYLPSRKETIMKRDGKLVIRPDTGKPHEVLCGKLDADTEAEKKGLVESLWNTFGGKITDKGYKQLDSHIGTIFGDSINLQEQELILSGLEKKGFSSDNVVVGIGSYAFQYVTRDTYSTVCKCTYIEVDGVGRNVFKNPKSGAWKKSHKGLLRVNPDMSVEQEVSWTREGGELKSVFKDGELLKEWNLQEIRERLLCQV